MHHYDSLHPLEAPLKGALKLRAVFTSREFTDDLCEAIRVDLLNTWVKRCNTLLVSHRWKLIVFQAEEKACDH